MKIRIRLPILYWIAGLFTSIIGYEIHQSVFYGIMNLLFWPFTWAYWLLTKGVSISLIKQAFEFFLQ